MAASTFVELIATMLLLTLFAALGFSLYWGSAKAGAAHAIYNGALRSKLSLAINLPRLAAEIRPPYWESSDAVFQSSGNEWRVGYRNGIKDETLTLGIKEGSRLSLKTVDLSMTIDNLPDLSLDWWQKDGRIIGIIVHWVQAGSATDFHAAWGSFLL